MSAFVNGVGEQGQRGSTLFSHGGAADADYRQQLLTAVG